MFIIVLFPFNNLSSTNLDSSHTGVSGRKKTSTAGRSGNIAPGSVVRRQGSSEPRMYIRRFPVFAAAGIRMVNVPLSSGVDISLKIINFLMNLKLKFTNKVLL